MSGFSFSTVNFELPWETPFRRNLWWILLLVVLLLSLFRHYIDMSAKSAAYGLGIYALLATALAGLTFVLFFQAQNKMSWLLLIMVVTALSTRLFEEIKRAWLRELIFLLILSFVLFGKHGSPF